MQLCLLREMLATVNTEAETALALQGLGSYPILQSGNDATRDRWIPGVASGDVVPAFALSEPDAGSDAGALALEARPDGDGWTLHGTKTWISNAPDADVYSVFARTTAGTKARGVTGVRGRRRRARASPASASTWSPPTRSARCTSTASASSRDDLLGEVDQGFAVAMRTLDLFRPSVGAFAVGMGQAALDASLTLGARARAVRRQADRPAGHPAHAGRDGDAGRGRSSAGTPRCRGVRRRRAGRTRSRPRAAQAKLFATETAQWVVDQAVQLHGARGLQRGHLLERLYREVRAPRIYEGASEVQRTIIARGLDRRGAQ